MTLVNIFQKKLHKYGFKNYGQSDVSGFLYDFDLHQSCSNKSKSTFGVNDTLIKQENHKVFPDNFLTSLSLIEHLKSSGI